MPIYNPYNGLEYQIGSDYLDAIEYPHEYKTYLEVQVWKFSSNTPSKTEIVYYSDLTDNVIINLYKLSKPVFKKKTGFFLEKILRKRLKSILLHS